MSIKQKKSPDRAPETRPFTPITDVFIWIVGIVSCEIRTETIVCMEQNANL